MSKKRQTFEGMIAIWLTELRTEHNMSQRQASMTVGLSANCWRNYETCRSVPSLKHMMAICDSFGMDVAELLEMYQEGR